MDKKGCIIVPYRDREEHLSQFIPHYRALVPELPIYVIEQADSKPFNRAKLLNVGFLEFGYKYDYAVYHDVDMLAENPEGYEYYNYPTHLATACSQFDYRMPYTDYFGGVVNIPTRVMTDVNGFSNKFWGYGGEDDEMCRHLQNMRVDIYSLPGKIYKSLAHDRIINDDLRRLNVDYLNKGRDVDDGLNWCTYSKKSKMDGWIWDRECGFHYKTIKVYL